MSGKDGDAPTVVKIPPKGSRVVRKAPTKGRRFGRRRPAKNLPEIDPGPILSWKQVGYVATFLLAAVVFTVLLFVWLPDDKDRPKPLARPDGVVAGEVAVVEGEVTVVDSNGNRIPPESESGSER